MASEERKFTDSSDAECVSELIVEGKGITVSLLWHSNNTAILDIK
jgi:hypothetical protein